MPEPEVREYVAVRVGSRIWMVPWSLATIFGTGAHGFTCSE